MEQPEQIKSNPKPAKTPLVMGGILSPAESAAKALFCQRS
jgi:hypothetical protein